MPRGERPSNLVTTMIMWSQAADVLNVVNVLTSGKHSPLMCLVGLEPIHTYGKESEKELMTENFIKNVVDIPICLPKVEDQVIITYFSIFYFVS